MSQLPAGEFHAPASEKALRRVRRHVWLLAVGFLVGAPAAYFGSDDADAGYAAEGTVAIEGAARPGTGDLTPIRSGEPLESEAWIDLLRSRQVIDAVIADQGPAAARNLSERLTAVTDRRFLRVTLAGRDAREVAAVLNAVMEQYVTLADELKRTSLELTGTALEEQLRVVEATLAESERDLQEFRIEWIRLSTNGSPPVGEQAAEEQRLIDRVVTTENVYNDVRRRVETARIAAANAIPDVRILDRALVPEPANPHRSLPIAMAILLCCLGAALGGALLLDRLMPVD